MSEVRYTDQHEWIRLEGDEATIGITKYAAESLGDVVFVELPASGKAVKAGGEAAVVESVKAASDIVTTHARRGLLASMPVRISSLDMTMSRADVAIEPTAMAFIRILGARSSAASSV